MATEDKTTTESKSVTSSTAAPAKRGLDEGDRIKAEQEQAEKDAAAREAADPDDRYGMKAAEAAESAAKEEKK